MKNTFVILAILPLIIFASCSKDEPDPFAESLVLELQSYIGKSRLEIAPLMEGKGYIPAQIGDRYLFVKDGEMRSYIFVYDYRNSAVKKVSFGMSSVNTGKRMEYVNLSMAWGDLYGNRQFNESYKSSISNEGQYIFSNRESYKTYFNQYKKTLSECQEKFISDGTGMNIAIHFIAVYDEYNVSLAVSEMQE